MCFLKLRQAFLVVVCPLTLSSPEQGCDGPATGSPRGMSLCRATGLGTPQKMCPRRKRAPWKGDQPQNWRATDPSTSGHQPPNWTGRRYFFNLNVGGHVPGILFNIDGIRWLSFPVPYRLLEIVALRWRRLIGWLRFLRSLRFFRLPVVSPCALLLCVPSAAFLSASL